MGWTWRFNYVSPVVPEGHGITMITSDDDSALDGVGKSQFIAMDSLLCDSCGERITGDICVARTMWRESVEAEPRLWENEYGHILPPQAVAVADALKDGPKPKQHETPY